MTWYTAKTPRRQYQLYTRDSGTLKQYNYPINEVNAVRLYTEMNGLTLPELSFASGMGRSILRRTIEAAAVW